MNEQMKKIAQALSINKENAGLWIQLILCILAILDHLPKKFILRVCQ